MVVVGASAGGVEALRQLISALPADFSAAMLVVLHVPPGSRSALPHILARAGQLPAKQAEDGDELLPGRVLVAGPDQHLTMNDGKVTLTRGPMEKGHRPAVDVLFRSAARVAGPRVIGVVLSGALDDGTDGLAMVRSCGGVGVVQDPADALHAGMPRAAIEGARPDHVVGVAEMADLLVRLIQEQIDVAPGAPWIGSDSIESDSAADTDSPAGIPSIQLVEHPTDFHCPDCHGPLALGEGGDVVSFQCRLGHSWSADRLLAAQSSGVEGALWTALRNLEDKASLTRDMGRLAADRGNRRTAQLFAELSAEADNAAQLVRNLLMASPGGSS